jgi:acyl-CoA hydrolase
MRYGCDAKTFGRVGDRNGSGCAAERRQPLGFILGGTVMHLIDIAGAIACHRHTRSLLVTAAVDDLQFLHSIKVGDLIILKSRVTCVFNDVARGARSMSIPKRR